MKEQLFGRNVGGGERQKRQMVSSPTDLLSMLSGSVPSPLGMSGNLVNVVMGFLIQFFDMMYGYFLQG